MKMTGLKRKLLFIAASLLAFGALFHWAYRPWQLTWGSTQPEREGHSCRIRSAEASGARLPVGHSGHLGVGAVPDRLDANPTGDPPPGPC